MPWLWLLLGPPGLVVGAAVAVAFVRRGRHVLFLLLLGLVLAGWSYSAASWAGALEGESDYSGFFEVALIVTNVIGWMFGVAVGTLVRALRGR